MTVEAQRTAPQSLNWTEAQRRQRRRDYERNHKATYASGVRKQDARISIPEDVERPAFDVPCFMCGTARGGCKHRSGEVVGAHD